MIILYAITGSFGIRNKIILVNVNYYLLTAIPGDHIYPRSNCTLKSGT